VGGEGALEGLRGGLGFKGRAHHCTLQWLLPCGSPSPSILADKRQTKYLGGPESLFSLIITPCLRCPASPSPVPCMPHNTCPPHRAGCWPGTAHGPAGAAQRAQGCDAHKPGGVRVCAHVCVCVCASCVRVSGCCMCACACACMHACAHVYGCVRDALCCTNTNACTYTHTRIHSHTHLTHATHVHIHAHTHTYTHARTLRCRCATCAAWPARARSCGGWRMPTSSGSRASCATGRAPASTSAAWRSGAATRRPTCRCAGCVGRGGSGGALGGCCKLLNELGWAELRGTKARLERGSD